MKGAEPDGMWRERALDVGDPVIQRSTHLAAMGVRHEDEAADACLHEDLNEDLRRFRVFRLPQVPYEMAPHRREEPFRHEMRVDIDDRLAFLQIRGLHRAANVPWGLMGRHGLSDTADAVLQLSVDDQAPAYVQLERRVRLAIADGTLQPGDRLPSVRQVAARLGVATNTVGRAYAQLAREGVIVARAGGGSEVAPRETLDRTALVR